MNIRQKRQQAIIKLIQNEEISTQDELIEKLKDHGYETTQATISRDIKEIKLIKSVGPNGKSIYSLGKSENEPTYNKFEDIFASTVISADYAMNTCVIKTHVGMANAACAAIDAMNWQGLVGTLAGDDTIFVLCRDVDTTERFCESVRKMVSK